MFAGLCSLVFWWVKECLGWYRRVCRFWGFVLISGLDWVFCRFGLVFRFNFVCLDVTSVVLSLLG